MSDLDIISIRDHLNEQTFEDGRRRVHLGSIAELFLDLNKIDVASKLDSLQSELERHDLTLIREGESQQELYVEQALKHAEVDMSWMGEAVQWAARITTVALEMVVPGVVGMWADQRLGTSYLGVLGLIAGVPLGFWHLIRMTRDKPKGG